jgi:epsilon-lactone hydrolase
MNAGVPPSADDPVLDALLAALARRAPDPTWSVAQLRADLEAKAAGLPLPPGVTAQAGLLAALPVQQIRPYAAVGSGVVLYLPGGGYISGSAMTHRALAARIAVASHIRGVVLEYPLAPEHPFPAAIQATVSAYLALLEEGDAPHDIVIGGDSAGGGLTAATLLALRERQVAQPAGAFLLSPWLDLTFSSDAWRGGASRDPMVNKRLLRRAAAWYLNGASASDPLASPVFADLRDLPPLLVQSAGRDPLRDEARRFAEKARHAGVETQFECSEDMVHVWQAFAPRLPQSVCAIDRIGAWIADTLPGRSGETERSRRHRCGSARNTG